LHLVDLLENAGIAWKAYAEPDFGNPDFTDCPLDFSEVDVNHVLWLAEMSSAESCIDSFLAQARTLSLHLTKSAFG